MLSHDNKKTTSVNTANFADPSETKISLGPLVDIGAPYSAVRLVELNMLAEITQLKAGYD